MNQALEIVHTAGIILTSSKFSKRISVIESELVHFQQE